MTVFVLENEIRRTTRGHFLLCRFVLATKTSYVYESNIDVYAVLLCLFAVAVDSLLHVPV